MRKVPLLSAMCLVLACASSSPFYQGVDARDSGKIDEAEALFREALKDPKTGERAATELEDILVNRARGLENADPAAARAVYEEALSLLDGSDRARMGIGRTLELEHKFDEAIAVLEEDPGCGLCKEQMAEVYEQRARASTVDERFEEAVVDLDRALAISPSADVYLDKCELFTAGHYGTAQQAVDALNAAHPMIGRNETQLQELWVIERREIAIAAVAVEEEEAVTGSLMFPDPRIALDATQRDHAMYETIIEVAKAEQSHGRFEAGRARGVAMLEAATARLEADDPVLASLKAAVLGLFQRHVSHYLEIGEPRPAAAVVAEALQLDPENLTLRFQGVLAMSAVDLAVAEKMMENIPDSVEHWHRVHALVGVSRAQRALADDDLAAAQAALAASGREFPDLLEVRLVKAEILARTRIDGLTRTDAKEFRRLKTYSVPGGVVNRYAEALAELEWARARWEEESVRLDPLRMPAFGARLGALEATLRSFYPFKVRKLPGKNPRVAIYNRGKKPIKVSVTGPGATDTHEIAPGKTKTSVFEDSGFVHVDRGDKELGLFAELKTLITVEI
jgi:tetratricopeptide (TPR) repeat protein